MKKLISRIVSAYTVILMAVFPLCMHDKYYDIQDFKMYFYLYSTIICLALVGACALTALAQDILKNHGRGTAAFFAGFRPSMLKKKLIITDYFVLAFTACTVISTVFSTWLYEAFWGNMGRFMGCYFWLYFAVMYFIVSRYYTPKLFHVNVMLFAGIIVCGWGVLDYYRLSPIGFGTAPGDEAVFSSTVGNINFLTAVESVYAAVSMIMFIGARPCGAKGRLMTVFYAVAVLVSVMGLICGRSDNSFLSLGFLIAFVPFYAFRDRCGICRYIAVTALTLAAFLTVGCLTAVFPERALISSGVLLMLANGHVKLTAALFTAALAALAVSYYFLYRSSGASGDADSDRIRARRLRIIWAALGCVAAAALAAVLYDANTGGHPELYAPASKFLIINDEWGHNRGFAWGLALKYFSGFNIFNKLFGTGPETFSVFVAIKDLIHSQDLAGAVFDSPHNDFLQHLIEGGLLGTLGYYGMVLSAAACGIFSWRKKCAGDAMGAAFAFAVLVFTAQSLVNVSTLITYPVMAACVYACVAAACLNRCKNISD